MPQVSVFSPTFFILKVKNYLDKLPNYNISQTSLYMDDLQISYRHPSGKVVGINPHDSINFVEKFAHKNGFEFSTSKTSMLHFAKMSIPPSTKLRLFNTRIQKSETLKYFGLMFDSKFDWKAHIQQWKSKCNKALNLMRSVSSTDSGAYEKTLIMICRSLIRSKIVYGCIVYNSPSTRELEILEFVSNEAMRISSGCFKSKPFTSLQVITDKLPLQIRRDKLSLKYYYKVKNLLRNPTFKFIIYRSACI